MRLLNKLKSTCKGRIKRLLRLGIGKEEAKRLSYSRKSYWNNSKTATLHVAISNKRLKANGLVFPLDHYNKVHINL